VTGDWSEPQSALRWHWGEAYVINCLGAGRWTAERRDTYETLRNQTPLGARPVSAYQTAVPGRNTNSRPPAASNRAGAGMTACLIGSRPAQRAARDRLSCHARRALAILAVAPDRVYAPNN
jgi:hypothetical protein